MSVGHNVPSPQPTPLGWFKLLVTHGMPGLAAAVSVIGIACFLLTFAKLFADFIFYCVTGIGLMLLVTSAILLNYAMFVFVVSIRASK
jgi:hypothetical protein